MHGHREQGVEPSRGLGVGSEQEGIGDFGPRPAQTRVGRVQIGALPVDD